MKPEEQLGKIQCVASFEAKVKAQLGGPLQASQVTTLQVNVGKLCNQKCKHCHVDAGPDRTEIMERPTFEKLLKLAQSPQITTVDLTGGAPEMNPHFRWFVSELRALGKKVIVRCNLTILMVGRQNADLAQFFADHRIHVVSSLPYYEKSWTDRQRGEGVFDRSIQALKLLNSLGYGKSGTGLELDLVVNPPGAVLPATQSTLEPVYRESLKRNHGIEFSRLITITNMPISRFLEFLERSGNLESYLETLANAYNPATVEKVMCRDLISVSWDGWLYDCDFNQMLELKINSSNGALHLDQIESIEQLNRRPIVVKNHCYGCTAGSGSSCGGQLE